jgi:hypothetical protein
MTLSDDKYYFLGENDNILEELINLDFPVKDFAKQLKVIGAKTKNNKIGFAQFTIKSQKHILCICPKNNEKSYTSLFIYLKNALAISSRHLKKIEKIDQCLFDLSHRFSNKRHVLTNLDDIVFGDLDGALTRILSWIKDYRSLSESSMHFSSSNIKNTLVIKKNAVELNKSKAHQKRRKVDSESIAIDYTIEVLRYFSAKKCRSIANGDILRSKSNRISSFIRRRFNVRSRGIRISKFCTAPIHRNFVSAKCEGLYKALLRLISEASLMKLGTSQPNNPYFEDNLQSFFVSPELIYELFVYEKLEQNFPKYEVQYQPARDFRYVLPNGRELKKLAKPDVLVYGGKLVRVVDAKWKCLKLASDIQYQDVVKLKRDIDIFNGDFAALVYPEVPTKMLGKHLMELGGGIFFEFWVFQINCV